MIDNLIQLISERITSKIKPSTLIKYSMISLIVASFLSLFLGDWIVILVLVVNYTLWATTEYLYAKEVEEEEGD